jgi:2,2-dialkylglycine decarboxylase (pyruvate)
VGLANIEILERERLPENAQIMGQRLRTGLEGLLEFPFVGDVRGRGLLNGVEIVKDKESRTPDIAMAARLADMALARGLRTRNVANVLAFAPPLVINSDEVDEIVRILGGVFDSVEVASA